MEYLKKIINNELKEMNEEERNVFRKTSLLTFQNMVEEFQTRINYFEKKVIDSIKKREKETYVYTTILPKDEYYLYEEDMSLIFDSDLKKGKITDLFVNKDKKKEKIVKTVFINSSYENLNLFENAEVDIFISSGDKLYENLKGKLKFDNRYLKKIQKLYEVFIANGVDWRTVNTGYAMKMFKVVIEEFPEDFRNIDVEDIQIIVDYKGLSDYIDENKVLVWNINEKEMIGSLLVRPTEDQIHYESVLKFKNAENIYACSEGKNIFLTYTDNENNLHIITEEKDVNVWKIWELKKIDLEKYQETGIKILHNEMRESFLNALRYRNRNRIRGEAEIKRIIESYSFLKEYFEYLSFGVYDKEEENENVYDMNDFILDEYKMKGKKMYLRIYGKILRKDNYTTDIISFLKSDIEFHFPEYKVLIKEEI